MNAVVVDSDALIGLVLYYDTRHEHVVEFFQALNIRKAHVIIPTTVVAETITLLKRRSQDPLVTTALQDLLAGDDVAIVDVTKETISRAFDLFSRQADHSYTFFDAIVAVVARQYHVDAVFSFNEWYKGLRLTLIEDYLK
jgi:predicted nucleic acid-binding protein